LTHETLRSPRIRACQGERVNMTQVCATQEPDTWITQYQRCLADGLLPLDPTEARKIKKNSGKFTMIDGELYRFGFTHPLLECVHGEKCTRIMAELHEGNMWESRRGSSSGCKNSPCRLLLANDEGRLQEVCTVLQAMSAARRLAQSTSRRAEVNLQPLAISHLGN